LKEEVVVPVRRFGWIIRSLAVIALALVALPAIASGRDSRQNFNAFHGARASLYSALPRVGGERLLSTANLRLEAPVDYRVKFAVGRTFGTSTQLDYTTVELTRRLAVNPLALAHGSTKGELQMAFLASHVSYNGGHIERLKRLDFHDGYEVGLVPKAHLTLPSGPMGVATFLESGAGIGYVSETYRNSGSRWNWSLLAGFGMEKSLQGSTVFSMGFQWRHLSNGNMWGKGDELHNSNSGTDMIQGSAALVQRF
jgi:hypothetical protein